MTTFQVLRRVSRPAATALAAAWVIAAPGATMVHAAGPDKAVHFSVSFSIGSAAYVGGGFIEHRGWRTTFGLGLALGAGAMKEAQPAFLTKPRLALWIRSSGGLILVRFA